MRRRGMLSVLAVVLAASAAMAQPACQKPVYLTLDTGHMGVAKLIADVLKVDEFFLSLFCEIVF